MIIRHYHLQKEKITNAGTSRKTFCLKKNIRNHGFIFQYNIRADPMLGICYAFVRWIPYIYSSCLRKMYYPCNIRQDKYNKGQYKGENH